VLNELQAKQDAQNVSLAPEAIEDLKEARLALTDMQLRLQNAPHSARQRLLEESLGLMTEGRATRYEDFESVQIFRKTEPENSAPRATSPVRILLVEDDENVRETSQFIYEQEGHVCEVADTCEGALRILAGGGPFDIIHIHRGLPDMDAFSFVRALRNGAGEARGTKRDTPIFVVTGAFEREDIARYRGAFDAAVARPANPAALRRLVRILTRGRRREIA
jgi:CheY-like chemotaxis protein